MIWDEIKDWPGAVEIDGTVYPSVAQAQNSLSADSLHFSSIKLCDKIKQAPERKNESVASDGATVYKITVRQYMTRPATPDFDFMAKWNNNNPMPLRTMIGTIEKETSGMVYMHLHGDITSEVTQYCLKCGRAITNPVSQFFGMGPECGGHNYTHPFESEEELKSAVDSYRRTHLQKIVWSGWIIKSSITEKEIVASIDK
jgi:hypothetical protein